MMEFEHGVWVGVSSAHTADGRQLGENNTAPSRFKEIIDTEYRLCKFPDSRNGGMINMTALRSLLAHWPQAMHNTQAIRQLIISRYCGERTQLTLIELYLLSRLAISLPAYLLRTKAESVKDGELPEMLAVLFQLLAGIFMIVRHMLDTADTDVDRATVMSAEALYRYCDDNAILTSADGVGVCGGSRLKIIELLNCAIDGQSVYADDSSEQSVFDSLSLDVHKLCDYMEYSVLLEIGLQRIRHKLHQDLGAELAEISVRHPAIAAELAECLLAPDHNGCGLDSEPAKLARRIVLCGDIMRTCNHYEALSLEVSAFSAKSGDRYRYTIEAIGQPKSDQSEMMIAVVDSLMPTYFQALNRAHAQASAAQRAINRVLGRDQQFEINTELLASKIGRLDVAAIERRTGARVHVQDRT